MASDAAEKTGNVPTPSNISPPKCFALMGNPNTGKTTLFNRMCGIRARTANFPGSTVEAHIGVAHHRTIRYDLVDLPGIYGLNLELPESRTCKGYLAGEVDLEQKAEALVVVADATNLHRNLIFISQAIQCGLPAVIALNMIDLARRRELTIDIDRLAELIGCPVARVCARTGEGIEGLLNAMANAVRTDRALPAPTDAQAAARWADQVFTECVSGNGAHPHVEDTWTDRLDQLCTHPVLGMVLFIALMTGMFYVVFALAEWPKDLIGRLFGQLGILIAAIVPDGAVQNLLVGGVINGVAGTVVFVPQICLLFFMISLLEDTGYLARAAFVMDRLLRRFGLPGQAFVPLLSAHACAIPAIMSARLIPNHRDRIATVLIAPFMSCSARLPVYVMLVGLLFSNRLHAGLAFTGCYLLGATAALLTALLFRRSILRGPPRAMVLELPTYKWPSLRTAALAMLDRAWVFLKKAGTVIVAICVVLWWLSEYPSVDRAGQEAALREAASVVAAEDQHLAKVLVQDADLLTAAAENEEVELSEAGMLAVSRHAMAGSFAGRIGRTIEPVMRPLGFDWQISVGVLSSFAAREVFVSTMAVLLVEQNGDDDESVLDRLATTRRDDGSLLFTRATATALLVFFVLGMQCLPTLPVTRRETGHWGWALLQLGYMSCVAYLAAMIAYQGLNILGVN
ncbi:MAG: ferrous iron transporter B [Phycisphaerales bacterium]|nr:MAG: ferrous iron transporter B [Phycisphaerales bacterium]